MSRCVDWLITGLTVTGGAELFVRQMAPLMLKSDYRVRVISLTSGGYLTEELRHEGIETVELGVTKRSFIKGIIKLDRLWSESQPDILHTHLYHAGIIGRIVAKSNGIRRVIVHQHGLETNRTIFRTILDRYTSSLVMCYAATCQAVALKLLSREKIPQEKIRVIHNGINLEIFTPPNQDQYNPILPGLDANSYIIGTIGRLSIEKGQETILEAIPLINHQGSFPHLVLIGTGPMQKKLSDKARKLGIEKQVHFLGYRKEVAGYLKQMDLYIQASEWEGVSLALLEAMGASLPVVATDVGGTSEIIEHMKSGYLIPPRDPYQLSLAVNLLQTNKELSAKLGHEASERIKSNFTSNHTMKSLISLYENLMGT